MSMVFPITVRLSQSLGKSVYRLVCTRVKNSDERTMSAKASEKPLTVSLTHPCMDRMATVSEISMSMSTQECGSNMQPQHRRREQLRERCFQSRALCLNLILMHGDQAKSICEVLWE